MFALRHETVFPARRLRRLVALLTALGLHVALLWTLGGSAVRPLPAALPPLEAWLVTAPPPPPPVVPARAEPAPPPPAEPPPKVARAAIPQPPPPRKPAPPKAEPVVPRTETRTPEPPLRTPPAGASARDWLADARALARDDRDSGRNQPVSQRSARVGSSSRDPVLRAYADGWRRKVEDVGRLNYPESARAQGLAGRLVLAADIAPDGTLLSARIEKGSGQPELDSAALNIVRLAAPYAPFPPALARDYDRLTLVRTWSFSRDGNLSAP
ncbi:hypothetical protein A9J41_05310 [Laribacter hongkongensis]|nr:hypothetical protein [Laribacter hongkongensis]